MGAPEGGELAGRVRACIAYRGLSAEALASQNPELKVRTLYRYMKDGGPMDANGQARRLQIAQACNVPERFMLEGFAEATERQPPEDASVRLDRLEREASELRALLAAEGHRRSEA